MKTIARLFASSLVCAALVSSGAFRNRPAEAVSQARKIKALTGGALIDGYGGRPLRNSVILTPDTQYSSPLSIS